MKKCCKPIHVYVELLGKQNYHSSLKGRDEDNQHPISAISGLTEKLEQVDTSIEELDERVSDIEYSLTAVFVYKGEVSTYDALPVSSELGYVYKTADTNTKYLWTGNKWEVIQEGYTTYSQAQIDEMLSNLNEALTLRIDELDEALQWKNII